MPQLWQDVRAGARALSTTPGTTAIALLSLMLGIGANTAIFSLVNALLLRPLTVPHPEQLVALNTRVADQTNQDEPFSLQMFENLQKNKELLPICLRSMAAASVISRQPVSIIRRRWPRSREIIIEACG
ncbi:MAG TPA: hypothetical protein VHZ55_03235 [Bryobacteraceae bacterium]|nr:hypothetical protein [Bryobacteraceae bacterium]